MTISIQQHVATLTFNQPDRANSLDEAGWRGLRDAVRLVADDPAVHVVVLAGEGKHFCAGMDLSVLGSLQQRAAPTRAATQELLESFILEIQDCITAIAECPKPVLAAIQGACIGGGVAIASACDIIYCTEDAHFIVKEVDFGIVADIGTLQRLPHFLPAGMVAELAMTGRKFYASEAVVAGLVTRTFSNSGNLRSGVAEIASSMAAKSPPVLQGIKHQLQYGRSHTTAESLAYVAHYSAALLSRGLRD
ncbi:enoyl-CoA hydratase-related protein [Neolewinella lacunae]|uniref:Enoyl-CoA hydratase/isomerase family protein n=1 Tax=Neolewinella lacunae TaxID=1517758 RepID=A0A923PLI9_9BACT|nr:enoyl-CoA hydratase-related protein [Neolewinella lacunae]MBC6993423.1 enoyl-CoA hydratase/isomerase family protein [Neolewinella lacunae]MDN3636301.1 enoyl-CoA hydratase-related protein [Neolewinella lacunae]